MEAAPLEPSTAGEPGQGHFGSHMLEEKDGTRPGRGDTGGKRYTDRPLQERECSQNGGQQWRGEWDSGVGI